MIFGLGDRIRIERTRKRLTQEQLAKLVSVDKSSISLYENGGSTPTAETILKMAQVFSVTTDFLLGLDKHETLDIDRLQSYQIDILKSLIDDLRKANQKEQI